MNKTWRGPHSCTLHLIPHQAPVTDNWLGASDEDSEVQRTANIHGESNGKEHGNGMETKMRLYVYMDLDSDE